MGCDIHLFLEYCHPSWGIEPIIANFFSVSRDYRLFTALAGVHSYDDDVPALFVPRGLPDDVSQDIHEQFYTTIIPDDADDSRTDLMHEWCYESDAKHYVAKCNAHIKEYKDGHRYVSNPDWHHASYLTRNEIIDACKHAGYDLLNAPDEFQMVMDFMQSIDHRFRNDASRIIFWFDN
ncbi:hypothetical protein [Acaryochloris sp. CCMEE 5410]|uniref:hypothetical protein n=1 Tax=Acaryochloris sp. CCMEE 5410 TaxID=310037 RepID=UPI0002484EE8|nr:hypothetical protein [Acaryochloris sp. CCMEE 5410]KAI9131386.1 hypothetical protein ON05_027575 [Acaryochloris sp. CCMEE 5410]